MKTINKVKTALITGASSGIGYELARCFAKDGYNLILVSRQQEALDSIAKDFSTQYGIEVIALAKDLFQPQAAMEIYQEVNNRRLVLDALVNDAGQGEWGEFAETDLQRQLDIIQLNIISLTALTYLFLQDMKVQRSGKILNLGSIAATMPHPYLGVYAATKAYVLSLSEALHNEMKDYNITITTLMPGATATDFFAKAGMEHTKAGQSNKDTAAAVAEAGYKAMQSGDDKIIPGIKNKMQVGMANIMTEAGATSMAKKQMEPSNDND